MFNFSAVVVGWFSRDVFFLFHHLAIPLLNKASCCVLLISLLLIFKRGPPALPSICCKFFYESGSCSAARIIEVNLFSTTSDNLVNRLILQLRNTINILILLAVGTKQKGLHSCIRCHGSRAFKIATICSVSIERIIEATINCIIVEVNHVMPVYLHSPLSLNPI